MDRNIIDSFLTSQVKRNKTPSVQYVIFNKDSIIHRFQAGFADIKNQKKTDKNTAFNAFSVTKTFTALAILQLAEKGRLNIENSVKDYLPDFPYSSEITIKHLLTHSGGIPNPIPLSWIHLEGEHDSFSGEDFFSSVFAKKNKTKFKPDEKFAYSNLGYIFLGQIIENVSELSYEDYIRENIIRPSKIDPMELDFDIADKYLYAKGYQRRNKLINFILGFFIDTSKYLGKAEGKWRPWKTYYVNGPAYGGLIGTSTAFVKYIRELLNPDCSLISDEYKEIMFTENFTNANKATGMCLSWFRGELDGKEYFAHAGGGGGYYCEVRVYPKMNLGSVIMFNRSGMKDERFLNKLDIHYF